MLFKHDAQETDIVVVDTDVNVDEIERKVGKIDRKLGKCGLMQVKHNGTHNRSGSSGGNSIQSRYQTKA